MDILVDVFEDRSEIDFLVHLHILIPTMNRSRKSRKSVKVMEVIEQKLVYMRELFLGRTKKQTRLDKPSFIGKAMLGMYGLFTVYSFILFALMNAENFQSSWFLVIFLDVLRILCFGDPYAFGIALTFALFTISLFIINEKILVWTFTKLRYLKQILIFFATTGAYFGLAKFLVLKGVDLYSVLLVFAMIWLIFQSVRMYSAARSGATKMEIRLSNRYSPIRYMIAYITPFILLGVITVIAWIFRYYIVIFTLDYIAVWEPGDALIIYRKEMETIMPMIYTGLLSIFILMITQIILSKKKGSTARAGTFDNLVFGVISMVMFLYSIYNIALYLFLDKTFIHGFSETVHTSAQGNGFFFVEFLIALVFFMWIVLDLTSIFGDKGFLFFNKNGFVIFLMSTLIAQTTARLGLVKNELYVNTTFSDFIKYDYVVLPWLILLFLGITIVVYWIKPQQASIFLRTGKAAREDDEKSMLRILNFLKREFIRRGEKFILSSDLINALKDMTGLSSDKVWSLIYQLKKDYIDIQLLKAKDVQGDKIVYFDFLPITATEKYQKGKDAQIRAKKYLLQNLFIDNIKNTPKKMVVPKKTQSSSSQEDLFIQALSVQYSRKIQDEESQKRTVEEENTLINQAVDEHSKEIVYGILQTEYIRRISQVADYRDNFNLRISDVSDSIARATKLPIARIYKLLYEMAGPGWNFSLSSNLENKASDDDKLIEFIPIDDWAVYDALAKHRPTHLKPIRVFMQKLFDNNIRYKRSKLELLPPLVYPDENVEFQRSYISRWWAKSMQYFGNHFLEYQQCINPNYLSSKFNASIKLIINAKMQEFLEQHARDNKPAYSPK